MKFKETIYQVLIEQGLHPGWVGNSIRIDQVFMIRFYPDGESYELMRFFSRKGWKSMAISKDAYTIAQMVKTQLHATPGSDRGMEA